ALLRRKAGGGGSMSIVGVAKGRLGLRQSLADRRQISFERVARLSGGGELRFTDRQPLGRRLDDGLSILEPFDRGRQPSFEFLADLGGLGDRSFVPQGVRGGRIGGGGA